MSSGEFFHCDRRRHEKYGNGFDVCFEIDMFPLNRKKRNEKSDAIKNQYCVFKEKNEKNRTQRFDIINENVGNINCIRFKRESCRRTKLNEIIELRKDFNLGVIRFILFNSKQNIGIADPAEDLSIGNVLSSTLRQFRFIAQKFPLRPVCCQSERDKSLYLTISK